MIFKVRLELTFCQVSNFIEYITVRAFKSTANRLTTNKGGGLIQKENLAKVILFLDSLFVNTTGEMSNFLAEDYDAVLSLVDMCNVNKISVLCDFVICLLQIHRKTSFFNFSSSANCD